MGALARATRNEVEELVAGDPLWWSGFCAALAEDGRGALVAEKERRGWGWGALWRWIVEDEGRYRDYRQALEAHVQMLALETVPIADASKNAKLRVGTRFKLAGKVDSGRWGDKVEVAHRLQPLLIIEVVGRSGGGRVIEAETSTDAGEFI